MPIDRIITASIQDGAVIPADLSTGGPSWDTSVNVTVSGRLQTTAQPAFSAFFTNDVSINGVNTLVFNTTSFNRTSSYNTSTGRFTAPVAGIYLFNVNISISSTASQITFLSSELYVNGSRSYVGGWASKMTTTSAYVKSSSSFLVQLNAGDFVQPGSEVSAAVTLPAASQSNFFNGYLVA